MPCLEISRSKGIHDLFLQGDIRQIDNNLRSDSFDCVLALDLIEHLKKDEGIKLLSMMERIAKKIVIVFMPNDFLPQGEYYNNPWQVHKSGWSAKEMKQRDYYVIGINGWKTLRGELGQIRYRPMRLWTFISIITQKYTRNHPKFAFHLLCIKNMKKASNNK